jgi:hypothetical protein
MGAHSFPAQLLCRFLLCHVCDFDHPIDAQRSRKVSCNRLLAFKLPWIVFSLTSQQELQLLQDGFLALHATHTSNRRDDFVWSSIGEFCDERTNAARVSRLLSASLREELVDDFAAYQWIRTIRRYSEKFDGEEIVKQSDSVWNFQCLMTTWYVSIEWQLTIVIAPVLIYILKRHKRLGLTFIVSLIATSALGVGVWTYMRGELAENNIT